MAFIWQNRNTGSACYKCYTLKDLRSRLQFVPRVCVSSSGAMKKSIF